MALDEAMASGFVEALEALPFFPSGEIARTMIANEIRAMCSSPEQAHWLIQKMYRTYDKWPGPRELRAAFCSKYKPADGAQVHSAVYADGIPSDREQGIIPPGSSAPALSSGPQMEALPEGHKVTADAQLEKVVHQAVDMMPRMPAAKWSNEDPVSKKLISMGFDPL